MPQLLNMQCAMLYDSEAFVVVQIDGERNKGGFELVDKRSNRVLFLHGDWSRHFEAYIRKWQADTPEQAEVESVLDMYLGLAQNPLVIH